MARIKFNDFREPAAGEAYEIAFDYLMRSGAVRDEYETFIFLAQRLTAMVEQGYSNRILMANRAISDYCRAGSALRGKADQSVAKLCYSDKRNHGP
jgi:hypothetical protein